MSPDPNRARALHFGVRFTHCSESKWPTIYVNGQPNFILLGHMTNQFQIVISSTVHSFTVIQGYR